MKLSVSTMTFPVILNGAKRSEESPIKQPGFFLRQNDKTENIFNHFKVENLYI
ncbi:hypothetical protein [Chryseobacterium taiwanense]|uniref:hypothetical protein n=1 Tax=Chryseobacterium taiwanense TaxID=363331 RepID=UPI0013F4A1D0|nr:hypothetical protein [Chryseobacterium taiwanense]